LIVRGEDELAKINKELIAQSLDLGDESFKVTLNRFETVLKLVKATNYFWIKLKKFPNNDSIRNDYRSYRNKKNRLRYQLLRKHSEKCIELGKDKPKKLWKIINETLKGNDSVRRNNRIESLKIMGRVVVHQKDIANALNEFYVNLPMFVDNSVALPLTIHHSLKVLDNVFKFSQVDNNAVLKSVTRLKSSSFNLNDGISSIVLKECKEELLP